MTLWTPSSPKVTPTSLVLLLSQCKGQRYGAHNKSIFVCIGHIINPLKLKEENPNAACYYFAHLAIICACLGGSVVDASRPSVKLDPERGLSQPQLGRHWRASRRAVQSSCQL